MIRITEESALVERLQEDVRNTPKSRVKIQTGHLPLLYLDEANHVSAKLSVSRWGEFSGYSFDLGCRIVKYCQDIGKHAKIILVVDDGDELERDDQGRRISKARHKSARRRFFANTGLPTEYLQTLAKYGLDNSCLVNDSGSNETPLISESSLKSRAVKAGLVAPNECSRAYKALLLDGQLFDSQNEYLVSLIPGQCKGNICGGVLEENEIQFDSSHVFFPHAQKMGGLVVENGKYVQKFASWTREMMFQKGVEYIVSNQIL
jgi:hypothetical protein